MIAEIRRMRNVARILGLLATLIVAGPSFAQTASGYPDHPVKVIVPFAAAGPTDVVARLIAQKLSDHLGKQFYVENQPGAGGNIGMANAAKAAPDGYTIAVVSSSFMVNPGLYDKIPYDPVKDFAPVTLAVYAPNVIVGNPPWPVKPITDP